MKPFEVGEKVWTLQWSDSNSYYVVQDDVITDKTDPLDRNRAPSETEVLIEAQGAGAEAGWVSWRLPKEDVFRDKKDALREAIRRNKKEIEKIEKHNKLLASEL